MTHQAMNKRDFLSLYDLERPELDALFTRAVELKAARAAGETIHTLSGKTLGMVFEKASTRTRVSFEVGCFELGAHAVYLAAQGTQIGRGEPEADTARVLGGYCHGILVRTYAHARIEELARHALVPVINGLSDLLHPCQLISDLFTVYELHGDVAALRYAWIGDGNNMANSWINAAGFLGLDLTIACPEGYEPDGRCLDRANEEIAGLGRGAIRIVRDPREAAAGADVISTDVWASMGQENEADARAVAFADYCVDRELLSTAAQDATVLHCLPAHRGEEIAADVIDGPQSAVWQQAENRLHAQKALLELLMG